MAKEIEETHERLRTLVQLDPSIQVESIKPRAFRPPADWSKRGEMSRLILSVLRQATEPLTARDIGFELIVERALDKTDQRLVRLMSKRVAVALRHQKDNGAVRSHQGPGQYNLWELVR
jgi:hypothetical protein